MSDTVNLKLFFNFRSPYCYLASKRMFSLFDEYDVALEWKPLGGWDGRSPPEVAKTKLPIARQDVARWTQRMGIPYTPPPITTEPTAAGAGSLYAQQQGKLREYVIEVMKAEWAHGNDIGDPSVLNAVAVRIGLDLNEFAAATQDPGNLQQLETNWAQAQSLGVIGVPSFVVGEEIFWGNDRIDFVTEHLNSLRLKKY